MLPGGECGRCGERLKVGKYIRALPEIFMLQTLSIGNY